MKNALVINGFHAAIEYHPQTDVLQGKFIDTAGPVSFEAVDVLSLKTAAEEALDTFLEYCKAKGIAPRKTFSGRFNLRVSPEMHADIAARAARAGKSLNQWVADVLNKEIEKAR